MENVVEKIKLPHLTIDISLLRGKRILICGKGGSGKSTLVSLLANSLSNENNKIIVGNM